RHPAIVVATPGLFLRLKQAPLRTPLGDFFEARKRFEPLRRREWAIILERHKFIPGRSSLPPRASRSLSSNEQCVRAGRGPALPSRRNCTCSRRLLSFGTDAEPRL